ncbi:hypothetical protein IEO21_06959 [Rhodonia placenta]|uniref:Uncharacterized protein n=1 Tax=Rhodonia placenta TaxID=104341 RepID=A0A8H7NZC9_9APHY|nr:hypothetical protein IEO21_06959 [Postia placenta]
MLVLALHGNVYSDSLRARSPSSSYTPPPDSSPAPEPPSQLRSSARTKLRPKARTHHKSRTSISHLKSSPLKSSITTRSRHFAKGKVGKANLPDYRKDLGDDMKDILQEYEVNAFVERNAPGDDPTDDEKNKFRPFSREKLLSGESEMGKEVCCPRPLSQTR